MPRPSSIDQLPQPRHILESHLIGQPEVLVSANDFQVFCLASVSPDGGRLGLGHKVEQLHLVPLIADVRVRPPKGMYGESNSIRYLPRNGAVATAPAATSPSAPAARPMTAAPTSTPAANGLPWKRQG